MTTAAPSDMIIDERLLADIRAAERLELTSYKDTAGYWTIGYGHKMSVQDDTAAGVCITGMRAEELLRNDVSAAKLEACHLEEYAECDTACRQNALVELIFELGLTGWLKFQHARSAIMSQNWQTAHDELLNSFWAKQVHATRATRIANYLLSGQYP